MKNKLFFKISKEVKTEDGVKIVSDFYNIDTQIALAPADEWYVPRIFGVTIEKSNPNHNYVNTPDINEIVAMLPDFLMKPLLKGLEVVIGTSNFYKECTYSDTTNMEQEHLLIAICKIFIERDIEFSIGNLIADIDEAKLMVKIAEAICEKDTEKSRLLCFNSCGFSNQAINFFFTQLDNNPSLFNKIDFVGCSNVGALCDRITTEKLRNSNYHVMKKR